MTIGAALVLCTFFFLILKDPTLVGKLLAIAIAVVLLIQVAKVAAILGVGAWDRWSDYQFAQQHDCYDPVTNSVHPVSGSRLSSCREKQEVHQRGTPLPVPPKCTDPLMAVVAPLDGFEVYERSTGKLVWDKYEQSDDKWCSVPNQ